MGITLPIFSFSKEKEISVNVEPLVDKTLISAEKSRDENALSSPKGQGQIKIFRITVPVKYHQHSRTPST